MEATNTKEKSDSRSLQLLNLSSQLENLGGLHMPLKCRNNSCVRLQVEEVVGTGMKRMSLDQEAYSIRPIHTQLSGTLRRRPDPPL
jgi:hypothetical protein